MTKILLIDDEEQLLRSLRYFFEDEGYDVYTALTGEAALALLRHQEIDVCVVDMRLPGIDGNELIRRANAEGLLNKFIIHTGSTDYHVPNDIFAMGITEKQVFSKPLPDLSVLVKAVKELHEENS